ncbi:MAG: hypothetical protein ABIQ11_07910, partial [Saprospiraceae bacterium]
MKNLVLLLFTVIVCAIPFDGHADSYPLVDGPVVEVIIEFGYGPDCVGWGICKWDVSVGTRNSSTISTTESGSSGAGGGGGGGNSWFLTIPKDVLTETDPGLLVYFEGKSTIQFPETFVAPKEFSKALGTMKDLIIQ